MKFQAKWLENGQEVDLPEMKVEGSLAVAELTKKHSDEFLPFILAIQDEATLRARMNAIMGGLKKDATDIEVTQAKSILQLYKVNFDSDNFGAKANELLDELGKKLETAAKTAASASIASTPFFLKRSLLEAYYMIKAYYREKAVEKGEKPKMPFSKDDLQELMSDNELSVFSKYSTEKLKQNTTETTVEEKTEESVKKK